MTDLNKIHISGSLAALAHDLHVSKALEDLNRFSFPVGAKLFMSEPKKGGEIRLFYSDDTLKEFSLCFADSWFAFIRSRAPRGPLFKALSKTKQQGPIIDATVGSGKDSLLILSWGFHVIGFERHPLVYLLLKDAYVRAQKAGLPFISRYCINYGTCFVPETISNGVVYYDPMYPKNESDRKSALPRQQIQLFRTLVGEDLDIENNINIALQYADRLILKRSLHSEKLICGKQSANATYKGKNTRYDLFIK